MAPVLGGAIVAAPVAAFAAPLGKAGLATATALRVLGPFIPGYLMGSGETYDEAKRFFVCWMSTNSRKKFSRAKTKSVVRRFSKRSGGIFS